MILKGGRKNFNFKVGLEFHDHTPCCCHGNDLQKIKNCKNVTNLAGEFRKLEREKEGKAPVKFFFSS